MGFFMSNVFYKALPGGLTNLFLVLGIELFTYAFDFPDVGVTHCGYPPVLERSPDTRPLRGEHMPRKGFDRRSPSMQDIIFRTDFQINLFLIDSLFLRGQETGGNKGQW